MDTCTSVSRPKTRDDGDGVSRVPITNEHLVHVINTQRDHPFYDFYQEALYHNIYRLVMSRALSFHKVMPQYGEHDLTSEGLIQVFQNLEKYDPEKAKFSTWVCRVVNNLFIKRKNVYDRKRNISCLYSPPKSGSDSQDFASKFGEEDFSFERKRIAGRLLEFMDYNPGCRDIIIYMIGDPSCPDWVEPVKKINVAEVARELGVQRHEVDKVMSIFRSKIKEIIYE